MRIAKFVLLIFNILFSIVVAGREPSEDPTIKKTKAYIKVIAKPGIGLDTLELTYCDNSWGVFVPGIPRNMITKNLKETFEIDFDDKSEFAYVRIATKNGNQILIQNVIEGGDNITIKVLSDTITYGNNRLAFEGKGKEKYECTYAVQVALLSVKKQTTDSLMRLDKLYGNKYNDLQENEISSYIRNLNRQIKYAEDHRAAYLKVLKHYKKRLSPRVLQFLLADCEGRNEYELYWSLAITRLRAQNQPKNFADSCINELNSIYRNRKGVDFFRIPEDILALSDGYRAFIVESLRNQKLLDWPPLEILSNRYHGVLRDRLITSYVLEKILSTSMDTEELLSSARKIVKTGYCKELLDDAYQNLSKGKEAYRFSLPDSTGKIVKLEDFGNKVIIMDFFFTGCTGCRQLTEAMHGVYETFKNNPKVAFVSINVDRDISMWKKSLESHKYTHEGGIDLYTDGLGMQHEIIRHYNIGGFPVLILIDKNGKILESNPPRPFDPAREKELIAIINNALDQ